MNLRIVLKQINSIYNTRIWAFHVVYLEEPKKVQDVWLVRGHIDHEEVVPHIDIILVGKPGIADFMMIFFNMIFYNVIIVISLLGHWQLCLSILSPRYLWIFPNFCLNSIENVLNVPDWKPVQFHSHNFYSRYFLPTANWIRATGEQECGEIKLELAPAHTEAYHREHWSFPPLIMCAPLAVSLRPVSLYLFI